MTTSFDAAALHAVRAATPVTAAEAVAWFTSYPESGRQILGYAFSAGAATWLRVGPTRTIDHVADTGDLLAEAYELLLFDGERELRWLREPDGRGAAVALGEDPAHLPPGHPVTPEPPPHRGDTHQRLLAGTPHPHPTPGWTTLGSDRYSAAHLPVTTTGAETLILETVEYVIEDAHGNLDVAEVRTVALRATPKGAAANPIAVGAVAAAGMAGVGTAAATGRGGTAA